MPVGRHRARTRVKRDLEEAERMKRDREEAARVETERLEKERSEATRVADETEIKDIECGRRKKRTPGSRLNEEDERKRHKLDAAAPVGKK